MRSRLDLVIVGVVLTRTIFRLELVKTGIHVHTCMTQGVVN